MTWDKERPYIPIDANGLYSFFGQDDPTDADIDQIYATGSWDGKAQRYKYVPFKRVRMSLTPIMLAPDRYGIWWRQGNDMFCMAGSEFKRIMTEMSPSTLPIDGLWSTTRKKAPSSGRVSRFPTPPTFYYDIVLEELIP